jgi:hypothetical protein
MSRRGGVIGLIASILIAHACAGLIAWRLTPPGPRAPTAPAPVVPSAVVGPEPPVRSSTIIDLPGDPVLVRRGAVLAPKDALISVPTRLGRQAPQTQAKAFFVNSTLVSSTGGYMGKFQEAGQEAEALAARLAMNSAQIAAAQNEPDYGPVLALRSDRRDAAPLWRRAASAAYRGSSHSRHERVQFVGGVRGPLLRNPPSVPRQ